jgi:hypothetical protein
MHTHMKQFTEPIFARLETYAAELTAHPLLTAATDGGLPNDVLIELAFHQFADSILWTPMLAQMRSMATRSRRLRRAIEENIAHEAGLAGPAHVTLAVRLMRSLGVTTLSALPTSTFARSAELWLSPDFELAEPELAGWLLTAETLVPVLFDAVLPAFERLPCDTEYFTAHVALDRDAHSAWMREAVMDVALLYGPECVPAVLAGMADAREETFEVPNDLWGRLCASR